MNLGLEKIIKESLYKKIGIPLRVYEIIKSTNDYKFIKRITIGTNRIEQEMYKIYLKKNKDN